MQNAQKGVSRPLSPTAEDPAVLIEIAGFGVGREFESRDAVCHTSMSHISFWWYALCTSFYHVVYNRFETTTQMNSV